MRHRIFFVALAAALFCIVVGAKWATFDRFGSPMPDWDQWDAEALELFAPWFEHDHFATHLFTPHNEHRVILTKLQNLTLGLLNGQWDSRLEAVTNAMLHGFLAVGFWVLGRRWLEARWWPALWVLILALFAPPVAWQNVLGGFHSQQYWLLGLSFVAIVMLPFAAPWSGRWWLGTGAAVLAMGSMGSGFLAAAVVLLVVGWRLMRRETTWREAWPTLAVTAILIAIGMATRVEVAWHQKLKATTVHDFVFSIVHSLQWPLRDRAWAALILWLPWLLLGWQLIAPRPAPARPPRDTTRPTETLVALGGWVLVQIVATAYARGAGADYPASRYMDTLAFGAMANGVALFYWMRGDGGRARQIARYAIALAWLCTLGLGLRTLLNDVLGSELPDAKKYYTSAEGRLRRYLASNDAKELAYPDIPFPSADGLVERLGKPSIRALMPLPIRSPLPLTPMRADAGFVENDARGADVEHPPRAGLSPATPPLDAAKSWGSYGATASVSWKSAPLNPTRAGWLKFEIAGDVGAPGVDVELREVSSGNLITSVRPAKVPGDTWRAAYVRMPATPFVVVAYDNDPQRWVALSGPSEMGALSWWAWQATKHGRAILFAGLGMTLVLCVLACVPRRRVA